jgi:hypothetical protein
VTGRLGNCANEEEFFSVQLFAILQQREGPWKFQRFEPLSTLHKIILTLVAPRSGAGSSNRPISRKTDGFESSSSQQSKRTGHWRISFACHRVMLRFLLREHYSGSSPCITPPPASLVRHGRSHLQIKCQTASSRVCGLRGLAINSSTFKSTKTLEPTSEIHTISVSSLQILK